MTKHITCNSCGTDIRGDYLSVSRTFSCQHDWDERTFPVDFCNINCATAWFVNEVRKYQGEARLRALLDAPTPAT